MKTRGTEHDAIVVELIAKDLHRHYRAISKGVGSPSHDHGWAACSKQKYFLQRAKREFLNARKKRATPKGK